LTRGPEDWPGQRPHDSHPEPDHEYEPVAGEFAGIALSEFVWARQRGRQLVWIWVAIVLAVTGLVTAAAWTIGSNLNGML
jgi:serine/threonine-protein kinase